MTHKSRYSRDDKEHIANLIGNLKKDDDYAAIFDILTDDNSTSYTKNSNGVFLNLSAVSDETLDRVKKYIKKVSKGKNNEIEMDTDIIPNANFSKNDRAYKLSNYEKNIIKQRNLKKILNDDNEYEEFNISSKKKKLAVLNNNVKKARNSKSKKPVCNKKTIKREE
jgi:hypothetical protein